MRKRQFFTSDPDDAEDERVQYLAGILTEGYISYFKLGEGGYALAAGTTSEQIATGGGVTDYTGTITIGDMPLAPGEVEITDGTQSLTDASADGTLSGDGSGTVDYKTGEVTVSFNSAVTLGTPINAVFKIRGADSAAVTKDAGNGDNSVGPYQVFLEYRPVLESSITIAAGAQTITDDGAGNLTGDGFGVVAYDSGRLYFFFDDPVHELEEISVEYQYKYASADPGSTTTKTDLDSEASPILFTFEKAFTSDQISVVETGAQRLRCVIELEPFEGIDDGNGQPPVFFEGGLFSESDVMMMYFTFQGFENDGGAIIELYTDQVI